MRMIIHTHTHTPFPVFLLSAHPLDSRQVHTRFVGPPHCLKVDFNRPADQDHFSVSREMVVSAYPTCEMHSRLLHTDLVPNNSFHDHHRIHMHPPAHRTHHRDIDATCLEVTEVK